MKKLTAPILSATLALAILSVASSTLAQDPPPLLSVYTEHVKLGHNADYETTVKELWAAMKKAGADFPVTASQSVSRPGDYTFVSPLSNMADMDHQNEAFGKAFAAMGSLMADFGKHSNGNESTVIAPRPDLSYGPASPRVAPADAGFARVMFLHPHPEHAMELEAAIKEFGELSKKKGITDGFGVYTPTIGEGPVYAIRTVAKSEADFYAQQAKNEATMGAEGQALRERVGPMLQKIEYAAGVPRPDLSYQP